MAAVRLILTFVLATAANDFATGETIPPPRPRLGAEAMTQPQKSSGISTSVQSACQQRLTANLAVAPSLPRIDGPGGCGADDVVRLQAIMLPNQTWLTFNPPAILRCDFAEAIVQWVREDVVPAARSLKAAIQSIDNYASYDCRARNGISGATLSEHGKAKALDVRSLNLADGTVVGLTESRISKTFRESLRARTCSRFMTVLGPGSDGYHEDHIHLDLVQRKSGARICQWQVRGADDTNAAEGTLMPLHQSDQ